MKQLLVLFFLALTFSYCWLPDDQEELPESVVGLRPVYTNGSYDEITAEPPAEVNNLGKIYYRDSIIFVNERHQGIHVIDNHDPINPIFLKFIRIPGNLDLAVRGDFLYADNVGDLVTINIADLDNITVVDRKVDFFDIAISSTFPDNYTGFFECVDESKGTVIGWEEETLSYPECWR